MSEQQRSQQRVRKPFVVPPQPADPPPSERRKPTGTTRAERNSRRAQVVQKSRATHRTRKRSLTININKGSDGQQAGAGQSRQAASDNNAPGSEFRTNEDIRAFSDYIRKTARNRAVLRAMDSEQLREVLRHIPDASGSKAGSRARARRVARHLTVIAAAEKLIARHGAALFAAFEREFESEMTKIGKGRAAKTQQPFRFS